MYICTKSATKKIGYIFNSHDVEREVQSSERGLWVSRNKGHIIDDYVVHYYSEEIPEAWGTLVNQFELRCLPSNRIPQTPPRTKLLDILGLCYILET